MALFYVFENQFQWMFRLFPAEKISDNIATLSTTVAVEPTKQYFWRVVVKDNKGGETIGQVWKFKTN